MYVKRLNTLKNIIRRYIYVVIVQENRGISTQLLDAMSCLSYAMSVQTHS